jgi:hypothetical protein
MARYVFTRKRRAALAKARRASAKARRRTRHGRHRLASRRTELGGTTSLEVVSPATSNFIRLHVN